MRIAVRRHTLSHLARMPGSEEPKDIIVIGLPPVPLFQMGDLLSVTIGGGIIGCTAAYFLTRHPSYNPAKHKITLLEASKIAGGASGKAGGLLALWGESG